LVVMPSGRQIFAFFCSPHNDRAQNFRCGYTAQRFHTARVKTRIRPFRAYVSFDQLRTWHPATRAVFGRDAAQCVRADPRPSDIQPRRSGPRRQACCAPRPQTSMVRFSAPDYTPGVEFRVFVAAVRDEVAAKISIQLRARAGTPGAPETLTFSYMVGGEQDAPVELRIGDSLYRLDKDDLLAFARAIAGKG